MRTITRVGYPKLREIFQTGDIRKIIEGVEKTIIFGQAEATVQSMMTRFAAPKSIFNELGFIPTECPVNINDFALDASREVIDLLDFVERPVLKSLFLQAWISYQRDQIIQKIQPVISSDIEPILIKNKVTLKDLADMDMEEQKTFFRLQNSVNALGMSRRVHSKALQVFLECCSQRTTVLLRAMCQYIEKWREVGIVNIDQVLKIDFLPTQKEVEWDLNRHFLKRLIAKKERLHKSGIDLSTEFTEEKNFWEYIRLVRVLERIANNEQPYAKIIDAIEILERYPIYHGLLERRIKTGQFIIWPYCFANANTRACVYLDYFESGWKSVLHLVESKNDASQMETIKHEILHQTHYDAFVRAIENNKVDIINGLAFLRDSVISEAIAMSYTTQKPVDDLLLMRQVAAQLFSFYAWGELFKRYEHGEKMQDILNDKTLMNRWRQKYQQIYCTYHLPISWEQTNRFLVDVYVSIVDWLLYVYADDINSQLRQIIPGKNGDLIDMDRLGDVLDNLHLMKGRPPSYLCEIAKMTL